MFWVVGVMLELGPSMDKIKRLVRLDIQDGGSGSSKTILSVNEQEKD